jgi:ABC-type xylose transport system permease subunit
MIPTLILFGLVFGRWWRIPLLAAAVAWPVALVLTGAMGFERALIGAVVLAVGNTLTGVLVYRGVLWSIRRARGQNRRPPDDPPSVHDGVR